MLVWINSETRRHSGRLCPWENTEDIPLTKTIRILEKENYIPFKKQFLIRVFPGGSVIRTCLPMQETWVRSLIGKDPSCLGATKPALSLRFRAPGAATTEPSGHKCQSPGTLQPVATTRDATAARSPGATTREKPARRRRPGTARDKQTNEVGVKVLVWPPNSPG